MDLSRHFTLAELTASNTAAKRGIANEPDAAAVEALKALCTAVLDPLRDALGRAITVNSGFRGPVLNKLVGGVPDSQHVTGQAVDIQSPGITVLQVFQTIVRLGLPFDQVIYEAKDSNTKWVHVSHKTGGNRGEIRVAQFGADGKPKSYPFVTAEQALAMSEPLSRSRGALLPGHMEMADEPPQPAPAQRKVATKVAAAKKAPATKAPAKKAPAKKAAAKKAAAKETAAKTAPAEKAVAAKKAAPAKAPAKKVAAKKPAAKKAPAKKAPAPPRKR